MSLGQDTNEKRKDWNTEIDILKGIGMLLVVLQHSIGSCGGVAELQPLSIAILSFHMPLFFFASGFTYKKNDIGTILKNKAATLLAPVVLYGLINAMIHIILKILKLSDYYTKLNFKGFWFLLSLLYIYVMECFILYAFRNIKGKHKDIFVLGTRLVLFAVGIVYGRVIHGEENSIATGLVGYGFFQFGMIFRNSIYEKIKSYKNSRLMGLVAGLILMVATFALSQINKPIMMFVSDYGNPIKFIICAVIGITGVYFLSWTINSNKFLENLGKNSLVILITHFVTLSLVSKVLVMLFGSSWYVAFICFVIVVVIEIVIVELINRKIPILKGKLLVRED